MLYPKITFNLVLFIVLMISNQVFGQKSTPVKLLHANSLKYSKLLDSEAQRLIGNVAFQHEQSFLYCDSAYFYEKSNIVKAFGHVYINDNDSVKVYGDSLTYDGNSKIAKLYKNVRLTDKYMTLKTNELTYDLNSKIGFYNTGGEIKDKDNFLKSVFGSYHSNEKTFYYKKNVVVINKDYTINCDTLHYNTSSETSFFHGPTKITSKENFIYCENGWYNSKANTSQFNKHAYLKNKNQLIKGDSLFYNRTLDFGKAFKNVTVHDSSERITVNSNFAEYDGLAGKIIITDSVLASVVDEDLKDTLFLHSDTLRVKFDTAKKVEYFISYFHSKFYRKDLQGSCDSLIYNNIDSVIEMYYKPILWSDSNQVLGKNINIYLKNKAPDYMKVMEEAFLISSDSLNQFNQIKGKTMIGLFKDGKFSKLNVEGNAESLYFVRDEEKYMVGIYISVSGALNAYFEENEIKKINYLNNPICNLHPDDELTIEQKSLQGYILHFDKRPNTKMDVFIKLQ